MFLPRHIFRQLLATITACLSIYLSGVWIGWSSAVLPKLRSGLFPFRITGSDITWIVALMDFGNLLSPLPASYMMDRFGRVFTLRLTGLTFCLASILALTASTPTQLYAARLCAGVSKGVGYTVAPMYIAEIAGPQIRGALSGIFIIMMSGGSASAMTFGPYISYNTLNWATLTIPVVLLVLSFVIEESPYFYYMKGDEEAALKSFTWFRSKSIKSDDAEMRTIKEKVEKDMSQTTTFWTLFAEPGMRKALKIVLITSAFQRLGGFSSTMAYASTTLPVSSFWEPKITLIIFGWSCVIGGVLSSMLIDGLGRKPLLLASVTVIGLVQASSALFYFLLYRTDVQVLEFIFLPHVGVILFGWFYGIGIGQVPHTLQSELFPTNVKSQASAMSTIVLSMCSFMTNKMFLPVEDMVGVYAMYILFAVCNFICVFFTIFCVFETKGKTLEEISDLLNEESVKPIDDDIKKSRL